MPTQSSNQISRRDFLRIAGGAAFAVAGASLLPQYLRKALLPTEIVQAQTSGPDLYFGGTDGWIHLPPTPPIGFYFPDDLAPAPFNTYIFGFRNITGLTNAQIANQKMHAQHNAPLFWVKQFNPDPALSYPDNDEFRLELTNLGLAQRPDLVDSHTVHWHGFRNVIPFYDGEPTTSVSVPVGRNFTYVYRAREPGTYMYHCHVEDVEHVHMGMTGMVFVRPAQDKGNVSLGIPMARYAGNTDPTAPLGYTYNDGLLPGNPESTAFDREFAMFLSEVWAEAHWADSHIQLPDWTDYRADFALLNGRVYPDTLAPNGSVDPFHPARDTDGYLIAPDGHPELQYQPLSALVRCVEGERVLLRFANLGFRETAMTLTGIKMHVIGKDATPMRSRTNTDTSYETNTLAFGAGESIDAIFTAPAYQGLGEYDTYILYNRAYARSDNLAGGYGGQMTELHVYPAGGAGAPGAQQYPNDWG